MSEDTKQRAPATPPRRRRIRRGRRALAATIAAGALWLAGYGAGWFGAGETTNRGGDGGSRVPSPITEAPAGQPSRLSTDQRGSPANRGDTTQSGIQAQSGVQAQSAAGVRQPTAPAASVDVDDRPRQPAMIEQDQLESLLSIVQGHVRRQDLGAAAGVLARLKPRVSGSPDGSRRVREWSERVRAAATSSEETALQLVRSGEVLAACRVCSHMVRDGAWRPRHALSAYDELGEDWTALVSREDLPPASPLPRRRWVRISWVDGWREGVVAGARDDLTTVRLQLGGRQQFPTLSTASLEPVDATASEAVEMAVWAARADAALLARLWMVRAMSSGAALGERGARMLTLLGGR